MFRDISYNVIFKELFDDDCYDIYLKSAVTQGAKVSLLKTIDSHLRSKSYNGGKNTLLNPLPRLIQAVNASGVCDSQYSLFFSCFYWSIAHWTLRLTLGCGCPFPRLITAQWWMVTLGSRFMTPAAYYCLVTYFWVLLTDGFTYLLSILDCPFVIIDFWLVVFDSNWCRAFRIYNMTIIITPVAVVVVSLLLWLLLSICL